MVTIVIPYSNGLEIRGSNLTGIGVSVMAMNLFAILVMLTLVLSVNCRENIADTRLKIESAWISCKFTK